MFSLIGMLPLLNFFTELSGDMIFVLKIFTLMAIFSYVTQHLGKGYLSVLIMAGITYFVIFDYFWFFGGVYVLYTLMVFGFSGIIVDFFFVNPGQHSGQDGGISNGKDFMARQNQLQRLRGGR